MPTKRRRYVITESDEVAAAIQEARKRWPDEDDPRELLQRLVREGHATIVGEKQAKTRRRLKDIERTSGLLTGAYPKDYLKRLRAEWRH